MVHRRNAIPRHLCRLARPGTLPVCDVKRRVLGQVETRYIDVPPPSLGPVPLVSPNNINRQSNTMREQLTLNMNLAWVFSTFRIFSRSDISSLIHPISARLNSHTSIPTHAVLPTARVEVILSCPTLPTSTPEQDAYHSRSFQSACRDAPSPYDRQYLALAFCSHESRVALTRQSACVALSVSRQLPDHRDPLQRVSK